MVFNEGAPRHQRKLFKWLCYNIMYAIWHFLLRARSFAVTGLSSLRSTSRYMSWTHPCLGESTKENSGDDGKPQGRIVSWLRKRQAFRKPRHRTIDLPLTETWSKGERAAHVASAAPASCWWGDTLTTRQSTPSVDIHPTKNEEIIATLRQ